MSADVAELVRLSKIELFDRSGPGLVVQSGGEIIASNFSLPTIDRAIAGAIPSIETFVVSVDGEIAAMGANDDLIAAWMPAITVLADQVSRWATVSGIELASDAFVTASLTAASEVNGEAHFDDDQFDPTAGAGLVAIVGDLGGPRVAARPIPHADIQPPRPVAASEELLESFSVGTLTSNSYGPNEVVVLPQFAQLHAGPGPCGGTDDLRHLLVYRVATSPSPRQ